MKIITKQIIILHWRYLLISFWSILEETLDTEKFVSGYVTDIETPIETLETEDFVNGSMIYIEIIISVHYHFPSYLIDKWGFSGHFGSIWILGLLPVSL